MMKFLCSLLALAVAAESDQQSITRSVAVTVLGAFIFDELKGTIDG